jgi:hypothetical protein
VVPINCPFRRIYGVSYRRVAATIRAAQKTLLAIGFADLAQLVVHLICNQGVGGSNPSVGTNLSTIDRFSDYS